ncbi:MAG: zinc ribbon domain-containing protein [Planctomycetota bacterium]|jgi:predicted  nucleic acid-binding Zn-ribbon protein
MSLTERLINLYRVDQQLRGLQTRLDAAQRYFDAQNNQLGLVRERLEELRTRKKHHQARIGNLETDGAAFDEQVEKFRNDLNSATTNKQYSAVLSELETVKTNRKGIDDSILEEMESIERIDIELEGVEGQEAERLKVCKVAEDQLTERRDEIGTRLEELQREREIAAADIPGAELAIFDEVAHAHDGEAMATVEEVSRRHREYACSECNMLMPFERIVALMEPNGGLVRCAACGRILYMQEELRGELQPK